MNVEDYKLGAFKGVFTPSILTIFGIILFLRFGYAVGYAGLWGTMGILVLGSAIAILTSLSLVAIVSNVEVKGGGLYFLISRSLGVEYGASCGLILYAAQAISVSFYVIGFTETLCAVVPSLMPYARFISTGIVVVLFVFVYIGVNWATRIQLGIMVLLFAALGMFLFGGLSHFNPDHFVENTHFSKLYFWSMFAIFFPAMTGFTQGTNLSGDLKKPDRDIPIGIFSAVFLAVIVYAIVLFALAGAASTADLQNDYGIAKRLAFWPPIITLGIFAGALSSGLASLLGAPRILQAVARDRIFPVLGIFAKGTGVLNEPRRATWLTFGIALLGIWCADLNTIAPIVTMFFLLTYSLMNYATFYEDYSNMPSFRPKFTFFHWRLSLLGTLLCIGAMFAIQWQASLIALTCIVVVYIYTKKVVNVVAFGDAKRGYYFQRIKAYLFKLAHEPIHHKAWRPQIISFCGRPASREALVYFSTWLEGGRGLTSLVQLIIGPLTERIQFKETEEQSISEYIQKKDLNVMGCVVVAPTLQEGFSSTVQAYGLGEIKPNTVLLGWSEQDDYGDYVSILNHCALLKKNIVIVQAREELFAQLQERTARRLKQQLVIDVWWRGEKNGRLMLLLAYLMTQNKRWHGACIRLLRVVDTDEAVEGAVKHLTELSSSARIPCEIKVCVSGDDVPQTTIITTSQDSALVFLGLRVPQPEEGEAFMRIYQSYISALSMTALVSCAEEIELS